MRTSRNQQLGLWTAPSIPSVEEATYQPLPSVWSGDDAELLAEGAETLLGQQGEAGSWKGTGHAEDDPHLATSLALLFLLQGRVDK